MAGETQEDAGQAAATLKQWEETGESERGAVLMRIAKRGLDRLGWTPAGLRENGEGFWHLVADAMEAEIAAREARAGFRAVHTRP